MIQPIESSGVESSPVYHARNTYGYDRREGRKMMAADWAVPLHRTLRRIYMLRDERPEIADIIMEIYRDLNTAINATRPFIRQMGIDTTSPLRRKPAVSQPQPVQPELTAPEQPGENPAETQAEPKANPDGVVFSARPVRRTIASALVRLAAAISPTSDLRPLTSDNVPVAPPNETPKGPTE